jgi:hypothetical protein
LAAAGLPIGGPPRPYWVAASLTEIGWYFLFLAEKFPFLPLP